VIYRMTAKGSAATIVWYGALTKATVFPILHRLTRTYNPFSAPGRYPDWIPAQDRVKGLQSLFQIPPEACHFYPDQINRRIVILVASINIAHKISR